VNIPICPNHRESKQVCERSDLRLHGESDQAFMFVCHTCKLLWSVSKPRIRGAAAVENKARKIQQATEADRIEAAKAKHFGYAHIRGYSVH